MLLTVGDLLEDVLATLGGAEPEEATKAGNQLAAAAIARVGALS